MPNKITLEDEALLVEYTATNDAYMHYDNYTWQVGAILVAGTFVFWGFNLDNTSNPISSAVGSIFIALLMSIWYFYSAHNRQIYLCKLHRLYEIEAKLGFKQHSRWNYPDSNPDYRNYGPVGYQLDLLIYVVASLGAPIINIFPNRYIWIHLITLIFIFSIIIVVTIWAQKNKEDFYNHLIEITKKYDSPEKV